MSGWRLYLAIGVAVLAALGAAFAAGRYTTPTKTIEVTKTEYVDRVVQVEVERKVEVAGPVRIQTRWRDAPAAPGCPPVQEVEQTEERGPVTTTTDSASASSSSTAASTSTTKTVETKRADLAIDLGIDWLVKDLKRGDFKKGEVDAALGKRIFGGVWVAVTDEAPTDKLGDFDAHRIGVRVRVEAP